MYNLADEGVQFSPTQLFSQMRRGCSASNGQGVQLGRYIHNFIGIKSQGCKVAESLCVCILDFFAVC